ncbi:MAG: copper resistance system multicopper oxidase [Sphingomonadales bacterium]
MDDALSRRGLLRTGAAFGSLAAFAPLFPGWARSGSPGLAYPRQTLSGEEIALTIGHAPFAVAGRSGHHAITVNGTVPGPLLRLREGQRLRVNVTNLLDEDTSIHWHGMLLPFQMDGVPGISFPGIPARGRFTYDFPVRQSGTYWYHSHSGLQEQLGHYAPIVIDRAEPDPIAHDREHVIVLSDWSFLHPHEIIAKLKKEPGYFNRRHQTLAGLIDGHDPEDRMPLSERLDWGRMRMDPTDILDVTAATYTYLINGHGPADNWTALFSPGERVRLRFINAAAMTIFNVRIPGLPMTVVSADGQNVRPVAVDEFQIGNAETYDVIVRPGDGAFTIVAESMDRSGLGRATLAPQMGMSAPVPPLRPRPTLTMKDMGMGGMDHSGHAGASGAAAGGPAMDHGSMAGMEPPPAPGAARAMAMGAMNMRDKRLAPPDMKVGVGTDAIVMAPVDRTGDPGIGLEDVGHRVLTYRDLVALVPGTDGRPPARTVEIHLTGNMNRFMWSIDGEKFSENPEPIRFERNERVRVTMINDTMMTHPMHLHGHFFEVVNGHPGSHPRKHTVMVLPGSKLSIDLTADAPGDWAFHCHLLLHMHAGMMRVVTIRPLDAAAA